MIVAIDLETTGLDNKIDKIIEIACILFDEKTFEIKDSFTTLINPQISLPEITLNITHIFDEDLKDAPLFDSDMIQKIQNFIGDAPILGHNVIFDRNFLLQNGVNIEENILLDTFDLANILYPDEKSLNLGNLCEIFGIELKDAHRAYDDTLATLRLFEYIIQDFKKLSKTQKEILGYLFLSENGKTFPWIAKYLGIEEEKISKEIFVKKILSQNKTKKQAISPSIIEKKPTKEDIEKIFENLPLAQKRENQLSMAYGVYDALFEPQKKVIEAPTGVGKTFAYLIPSILKALYFDEQVVISTHTKVLQDQIFEKDLEFLSQNLPYDFTYTKIKGRGNYFSYYRYFEYIFSRDFLDDKEIVFLSKIGLWLSQTVFGELDEVNVYPHESTFVKHVTADHFMVLSEENEFRSREFLHKIRQKSADANILIVNHAFLVQSSESKNSLLGQVDNLIIDEAHNLEDTITDASMIKFSLQELFEVMKNIEKKLLKTGSPLGDYKQNFENISLQVSLVFDILYFYTSGKNTYGNENFSTFIDLSFFTQNSDIENTLLEIESAYNGVSHFFESLDEDDMKQIGGEVEFFDLFIKAVKIALTPDSRKEFIPIFSTYKSGNHTLAYTILYPGKTLKNLLWNHIHHIVLTSATLAIGGSFDYISKNLDLGDFEFLALQTDFDYQSQALLFIPNDLGTIKYKNPIIHTFILDFLHIVKGNTLMLFTSYMAIKEFYLALNIDLKKQDITLLAQGIGGSKHKVGNHFMKYANNSVLMGTDSFWEGVDISGDTLKYLVIHKFPFMVPTDPIFQARKLLYRDDFLEYSLPKAILKTKQGFGRLIRSKTDTGIVILLDDRIFSTRWGESFYQAFPSDIKIKLGGSRGFLDILAQKHKK